MNSLQFTSLVQFRAPDSIPERKTQAICNDIEEACIMNGSQALQIRRRSWGKSIIDLVPRSPQLQKPNNQSLILFSLKCNDVSHRALGFRGAETYSISTSRRQNMHFQDSIIRRDRLKCNISMPAIACEFTWLSQRVHCRRSAFLLLHTTDNADLITELATRFSDGMDVKP
jgi:hypothetical protein